MVAVPSGGKLARLLVISSYQIGLRLRSANGHPATGSTDVGNVSYRCPAIQPEFAITTRSLDLHTREFAAATTSEEGHEALVRGARIIADICLKVFTDEELRKKIKAEFEAAKK